MKKIRKAFFYFFKFIVMRSLPSDAEIDAASRKHGVKTIKGHIEWEQEQFGNKKDSFKAGCEWMRERAKGNDA